MFYGLINVPDFRPSKAHPVHRAQRKAIENKNPHFDLKDAGLKAGVLVVLAAVACYPRIKAEHDIKNHPERFAGKGKGKGENKGKGKDSRRGGDEGRDWKGDGYEMNRERRRSEGYERRRNSTGWDRERGSRQPSWDRRLEGTGPRRSAAWDRDIHRGEYGDWNRSLERGSVRRSVDGRW